MIYDCFTFSDELTLLEIRLSELERVVNHFILVESTVTVNNIPKPLYYDANKARFSAWNDKIIHVIVTDSPNTINSARIEKFQFNAIQRGLNTISITPKDYIFLSNINEVPNKESVLECAAIDLTDTAELILKESLYRLDRTIEIGLINRSGTRAARYSAIENNSDIHLSIKNGSRDSIEVTLQNAGWRLTLLEVLSRNRPSRSRNEKNR